MCDSASMIATQNRFYWSTQHDNHSELIAENNLREVVAGRQALVKLEGRLLRLPAEDPKSWEVIIDRESQGVQDLPLWWEDDAESYLSRARTECTAWWKAKFVEAADGSLTCEGHLSPVGWGADVLAVLQSVGGYLYAREGTSFPVLQSVGGYLYACEGTSFPVLQSVGGYLYAREGTSFPVLQSVGGNLDAREGTSFPVLQSVGNKPYSAPGS